MARRRAQEKKSNWHESWNKIAQTCEETEKVRYIFITYFMDLLYYKHAELKLKSDDSFTCAYFEIIYFLRQSFLTQSG